MSNRLKYSTKAKETYYLGRLKNNLNLSLKSSMTFRLLSVKYDSPCNIFLFNWSLTVGKIRLSSRFLTAVHKWLKLHEIQSRCKTYRQTCSNFTKLLKGCRFEAYVWVNTLLKCFDTLPSIFEVSYATNWQQLHVWWTSDVINYMVVHLWITSRFSNLIERFRFNLTMSLFGGFIVQ